MAPPDPLDLRRGMINLPLPLQFGLPNRFRIRARVQVVARVKVEIVTAIEAKAKRSEIGSGAAMHLVVPIFFKVNVSIRRGNNLHCPLAAFA